MTTIRHSSSTRSHTSSKRKATGQPGYLLGPGGGENLVHFRDGGAISIKASPATGSDKHTLATQQVMKSTGIPLHRHLDMDEVFYVLEGHGTFSLNGAAYPFERGTTIFIPQNAWHELKNPDSELLLLWVVTPGGLDGFFRDTCARPGELPKQFTSENLHAIALQYGTEFR